MDLYCVNVPGEFLLSIVFVLLGTLVSFCNFIGLLDSFGPAEIGHNLSLWQWQTLMEGCQLLSHSELTWPTVLEAS